MAQQTFSGVPGDFTAGQVLTAADMDKLREFLLYLIKDGDEGDTGETSPLILDLGSDIVDIVGDVTITGDYDLTIGTANTQILAAASGSAAAGAVTYSFFGDTDTGMYRSTTNEMRWATGGADRLTLNAAGNMGLGTASPSGFGGALFQIEDAGIASLLITDGTATFQTNVTAAATYTGTRSAHDFSIVSSNAVRMTVAAAGAVTVGGDFTVSGTKNFDIPHPTKGGDWRLRHSSVEAPRADLIYRGTVTLAGGTATVDLDEASNMTDGTWEALCRDPWSMVASSGNAVEWSLSGKTLTITGPADTVCNWMVIAERHDDHMKGDDCLTCDDDGHSITEYEREGDPFGPIEGAAA